MVHVDTLKNGIRIVMEPMSGCRSVSFGVFVSVGSVDETPENNGMAHVIEHMMFKGTPTRSARDIADETTAIGGNLDAYTTKEYTCFYTQTLDIYLKQAVWLMADMLNNSVFDENELKKELGVILEEIDMYEDDAEELVHEYLQENVWENQSLGFLISGKHHVVEHFTSMQLHVFKNQYYTGKNIVISVAGSFDMQKVRAWIEQLFGDIPAGAAKERKPHVNYHHHVLFRHKAIDQMHIDLAYPCIEYDHKDKYLFTLFNNIFGDNPNSRLFQEIRENRGLTYAIYSYESTYLNGGLFQIYAAVSPEQVWEVVEGIRDVIGSLAHEPITEHDLKLARAQIETELMIAAESSHTRMENNGTSLIYGDSLDSLDKILSEIEAIHAGDVNAFIKHYLMDITPSLCIVGDMTQIEQATAMHLLKGFSK